MTYSTINQVCSNLHSSSRLVLFKYTQHHRASIHIDRRCPSLLLVWTLQHEHLYHTSYISQVPPTSTSSRYSSSRNSTQQYCMSVLQRTLSLSLSWHTNMWTYLILWKGRGQTMSNLRKAILMPRLQPQVTPQQLSEMARCKASYLLHLREEVIHISADTATHAYAPPAPDF